MCTVKTERTWSFPLWRTLGAGCWQERKSSFSHKMYKRCLQGCEGSACSVHVLRLRWTTSPMKSRLMKNWGWVQTSDYQPVHRWCRTEMEKKKKKTRALNFNSGSTMVKEILHDGWERRERPCKSLKGGSTVANQISAVYWKRSETETSECIRQM